MQRRDFLKILSALPFTASLAHAATPASSQRSLILIELKGGNDSLNTFIPYRDPLYYQYRPRLAIDREQAIPLSGQLALHPALQPLLASWRSRQLAIVQGLGYATPNLSHFRSIEIWNTGSDSDETLADGWVARHFAQQAPAATTHSLALGGDADVILGPQAHAIVMQNPKAFLQRAEDDKQIIAASNNPALQHIIDVQNNINQSAHSIRQKLRIKEIPYQDYPRGALGRQFAIVEQMLKDGLHIPVFKLSHGSFDTHVQQANKHQQLLTQLAGCLQRFAQQMQQHQLWDKVLISTYAEFGRRVKENGNRGTDHGTAASHLLLGGNVKGGIYGQAPALDQLDNGNLIYRHDYRQLYSSIIEQWWQQPQARNPFAAHRPFALLKTVSA